MMKTDLIRKGLNMEREYEIVVFGTNITQYTYHVKTSDEKEVLNIAKRGSESERSAPEIKEVSRSMDWRNAIIKDVTKSPDGKLLLNQVGLHQEEMEFIDEAICRTSDAGLPCLEWPEDLDLDLGFETNQYIPSLKCRCDIRIYFRCCDMFTAEAYIYHEGTMNPVIPDDEKCYSLASVLDYISVSAHDARKWGWHSIDSDTIISYLNYYDAHEDVEKALDILRKEKNSNATF